MFFLMIVKRLRHYVIIEMIEFEALDDQADVSDSMGNDSKSFYYTGSIKAGYVIENWEQIAGEICKSHSKRL